LARAPQRGPSPGLDVVFESGTVTTLSAPEIAREGDAALRAYFGPNPPLTATGSRADPRGEGLALARERWLFEFSVLSCLDHMLVTARRGHTHAPRVSLADAFVGSLHASFNAAYLYPELVYAHELLTLGAWLGNLVRGRAALLPTFVAERLRYELSFA